MWQELQCLQFAESSPRRPSHGSKEGCLRAGVTAAAAARPAKYTLFRRTERLASRDQVAALIACLRESLFCALCGFEAQSPVEAACSLPRRKQYFRIQPTAVPRAGVIRSFVRQGSLDSCLDGSDGRTSHLETS